VLTEAGFSEHRTVHPACDARRLYDESESAIPPRGLVLPVVLRQSNVQEKTTARLMIGIEQSNFELVQENDSFFFERDFFMIL